MRYLFSFSLLLIALSSSAQNDTTTTKKHQFEIGTDLNGLILSPIIGLSVDNITAKSRLQVKLSYTYNNLFYFQLAAGIEKQGRKTNGDNLIDYRLNGSYVKPEIGIKIGRNVEMGLGIISSNFKESCTIRFEGEYFDSYTKALNQQPALIGGYYKFGYNQPLSHKFSLLIETQVIIAEYTSTAKDNFSVKYAPGSGRNLSRTTNSFTGFPLFVGLNYKLN